VSAAFGGMPIGSLFRTEGDAAEGLEVSKKVEAGLMYKVKMEALALCKEEMRAFAECTSDKTFSIPWECRSQQDAINACLQVHTQGPRLRELKREYIRGELARAGKLPVDGVEVGGSK